jgi:hypothetical protein
MTLQRLLVAPAIALSLALCACDPSGDTPDAAVPSSEFSPMDREITALKGRESDPARLDAEYRGILSSHGYEVPAPALPAPLGPVSVEEPEPAAEGPLAKASAFVITWKTVKDFPFNYAFAYLHKVSVANNATVTATANRVSAPTDPVLVAYYKTGGTATAYTIRAVYYNDDRGDGSLNSYITWKNTTGATVNLEIMAYAYSSASTGQMKLTFTGPGAKTVTANVLAYPELFNSNPGPFPDCGFPQATQIQLKRRVGGGFQSGLLALNRGAMRGGYIQESGDDLQTLFLDDVLTNGSGSFMLGVMLDTDEPVYESTGFQGIQKDKYLCTLKPF